MAKILINGFDGKLYVDNEPKLDLLNFNDDKSMLYRGVIADATDLNDIVKSGVYHQTSDAGAESGVNYPSDYAGVLTVKVEASNVYQQYHVIGVAEAIYYRSAEGGSWSPWAKIMKDGDVDVINDIAPLTTKVYSSSKTESVIDEKIAENSSNMVDASIVPFDSVFHNIGTFDFSIPVAPAGVCKLKSIIAIENTSATDYKFIALYFNGTNSYAIPVQCVGGVVTYGTALQIIASEVDFGNAIVMPGNRLVVSLTSSFVAIDYSTFLVPTMGSTVSITTTAGTLGLKMIKMDATRISYVYTSSTPQTYVGCLDIGASGTTITKGTEVSMATAYNSVDVYLFKNTSTDKVDAFIRSSATAVKAIQYNCAALVSTISTAVTLTIGTMTLNPGKFISIATGKYLLASVTSTIVLSSFTVTFDQTTTLAVPVNVSGTITVAYSAVTNDVMVVKTKVANKYLLIYGNSSTDYSASGMMYGSYDSSTGALTQGTSINGLYGSIGNLSSVYGGVNFHFYDMATSTEDFIVLSNTSQFSAIRVDISNSTGLVTATKLYKTGTAFIRGYTVGQYRYVQIGNSANYYTTPMKELSTGKEFYVNGFSALISDYNGLMFNNDATTASLFVFGSSPVPYSVSKIQVMPSFLSTPNLLGDIKNYIIASNAGPFVRIIKKK